MIDTLLQKSSLDTSKVDTLVFAYNYKNQRVMKLLNSWTDDCIPDQKAVAGPGNKGGASTETTLGCSNRIWKATFYVWSGDEVVAEYNLQDELLTQYIIANGTRVARLTPTVSSKDTLYLHHDRAGSLRMVTSRTGTVVQKLSYDAFGEVIVQVGSSSIDYTYTGQDWDSEWGLNLFYLRNRYYNPSVGRFLTPDPLVSDLNPYSYCNNNPVMMSDPSGLSGWWFGIKEAPTGGTAGPVRFGSGVGTARTRSGVATWGNGGWVDPETRTINNGGRGRGATDQYGRPLFTATSRGGFEMGPSLRAIMASREHGETTRQDREAAAERAKRHADFKAQQMKKAWDKAAGGEGKWRPDSDGKITRDEAYVWWKLGNGESQTVPLSSIDFSEVSRSEFTAIGKATGINLFGREGTDIDDQFVYGGLSLTLQEDGTVVSSRGFDRYDCDYRDPGTWSEFKRDAFCLVFNLSHGAGTPFNIYLTGSATLGH